MCYINNICMVISRSARQMRAMFVKMNTHEVWKQEETPPQRAVKMLFQ